jgi:hypothetical protein
MWRIRPAAGWLAAMLLVTSTPVAAQLRAPYSWPASKPVKDTWDAAPTPANWGPAPHSDPQYVDNRSPVVPMLLSAVLPGAGQHVLTRDRKWIYLAVEVLGWAWYADRRLSGAEYRDRYRDFAWEEARIQAGPRVDGGFPYYETMSNWTRSGVFDRDSAPGVQPELDPTTFNGSIWMLASGIFLPPGPPPPESDPAYQRALQYYVEHAYSNEFLWDWSPSGGAQQEFGDLIRASDRRFQRATTVLGAVFVNHVVSAIDAYLTARGVGEGVEARVAPTLGPWGSRWSALVRVPAPR